MVVSRAAAEAAADPELRLVSFDVGGDLFALDIMAIAQIIKYEGCTEVPRAPAFVEGIILLRNQVIPLVDLRRRLFPDRAEATADRRILIVRIAGILVGLKVEHVRKIVTVRRSEILPAPSFVQGVETDYLAGVVRVDGDVMLLVDLTRIFSRNEQSLLDSAAKASEAAAAKPVATTPSRR